MRTLPVDSEERKRIPLVGGCLRYFPAALAGVAAWSRKGNDKHNPGEPLHWSRGKSSDHDECIIRHTLDLEDLQAEYERNGSRGELLVELMLEEHDARCWRALAASQEFREKHGRAPLAPGARLPDPIPLLSEDENCVPSFLRAE